MGNTIHNICNTLYFNYVCIIYNMILFNIYIYTHYCTLYGDTRTHKHTIVFIVVYFLCTAGWQQTTTYIVLTGTTTLTLLNNKIHFNRSIIEKKQ